MCVMGGAWVFVKGCGSNQSADMKRAAQSDFRFMRMTLGSMQRIFSVARVGARLVLLPALVVRKDDQVKLCGTSAGGKSEYTVRQFD